MNSLQTLRNLLPNPLPLQINPRHPALLHIRLVLPPIQRKRDIEQLPRELSELVERQRVARRSGGGVGVGGGGREELVVAHGEEGLGVEIGEEEEGGP